MARTPQQTNKPGNGQTSALAKLGIGGTALSTEVMSELAGLKGLGYSERIEDSLVPILSILQDNSGEVKKKHDRYIEGAEPGDMIIRSRKRVLKGDVGMLFIPAGFQHMWVEWNGEPGEGFPVRQYLFDDKPDSAEEVDDPNNEDRTIWRMPNGNRIVDTRYHYGYMVEPGGDPSQLVIPMSGTNHSVSRGWTSLMKELRVPGTSHKAPSWFHAYMLTTVFSQRGALSWYKYSVNPVVDGWVGDAGLRGAGKELAESVSENKVQADIAAEAEGAGGEVEQRQDAAAERTRGGKHIPI